MAPAKLRKVLRWGHIMVALLLGAYLYSPLSANPTFAAIVLYGVVPLMGVSGVWMWRQAWIARMLGGGGSAS